MLVLENRRNGLSGSVEALPRRPGAAAVLFWASHALNGANGRRSRKTASESSMTAIEIYDTTLRDGTQGLGVNLSMPDKLAITKCLDAFGVAFIEGGWPGSNPKDEAYFQEARRLSLQNAK